MGSCWSGIPSEQKAPPESVTVFGINLRVGDRVRIWPQKTADISMSRSWLSISVLPESASLLRLSSRCMLLSTVFLFALLKSRFRSKLGAGWGSRGESMLPLIGRPLWPKSARSHRNTVLGQRVNIIKPHAAAGVEGYVGFLCNPDAMEQDRQLPCDCNHGLVFSLLATSSCEMSSPLSKCRVSTMGSKNVVRTLDQQTS
jgi:hypothetical protein